VARDGDRVARFTREAQTLGSLNHHISPGFGDDRCDARRGAIEVDTPIALFPVRLAIGGNIAVGSVTARAQWAVGRAGRFLMITPVDDAVTSPITIVLNWTAALAKK